MIDKRILVQAVKDHMGWNKKKAILWFETPNPNFGGASPKLMCMLGRGHKVLEFVQSAIDESPPKKKNPARG